MEVRGSIPMSFLCPVCDKRFEQMIKLKAHYLQDCKVKFDFWDEVKNGR